jgi:hypothetical protein
MEHISKQQHEQRMATARECAREEEADGNHVAASNWIRAGFNELDRWAEQQKIEVEAAGPFPILIDIDEVEA